jgi:mersacidin/lichenicidin family type 2 lantibiotic
MPSQVDVERALRDKDYYNSLTETEQAQVPLNPAGEVQLSDEDLSSVAGGAEADSLPQTVSTGTGSAHPPCQCTC